jgi:hypothetical protein
MAPISTTPEFFRGELRPGPPSFKGKEHALAPMGVEIV